MLPPLPPTLPAERVVAVVVVCRLLASFCQHLLSMFKRQWFMAKCGTVAQNGFIAWSAIYCAQLLSSENMEIPKHSKSFYDPQLISCFCLVMFGLWIVWCFILSSWTVVEHNSMRGWHNRAYEEVIEWWYTAYLPKRLHCSSVNPRTPRPCSFSLTN